MSTFGSEKTKNYGNEDASMEGISRYKFLNFITQPIQIDQSWIFSNILCIAVKYIQNFVLNVTEIKIKILPTRWNTKIM